MLSLTEVTALLLYTHMRPGRLVGSIDPAGTPLRVVTRVDADRFNCLWLDLVSAMPGH